jgi:hypothetical protein
LEEPFSLTLLTFPLTGRSKISSETYQMKEVNKMEPKERVSLCPICGACPEVQIYDSEVKIGEEGNMVRLKVDEWNTLVERILSGKLGKL